jgi:hypothetical protein
VPAWDGSKAICPLLEAYAAYACPADLKTWTCGWCRKMSQEKAAGVCTPLEYVTVVQVSRGQLGSKIVEKKAGVSIV